MVEPVTVLPIRITPEVVDIGTIRFEGHSFEYPSARVVATLVEEGVLGTHLCLDFVQLAGAHTLGWGVSGPLQEDFESDVSVHPWLSASSDTKLLRSSVASSDVELWGTLANSMPYHYTFAVIDLFDIHILAETCIVRPLTSSSKASRGDLLSAADELGPPTGYKPDPAIKRAPIDCRFEIPVEERASFIAMGFPHDESTLLS